MVAKKKKSTRSKAAAEIPTTPWPAPDVQPMENINLTGSALRGELRAFKGKINEQAGRTIVGFASEATSTFMLRRPFGITDLDIATGGGAPAGGPIQIAGPEASGKTYLAMQCMLMHQLIRGEAFSGMWVCAEPTLGFDFKRAAKMGLKIGLPSNYIPQLQQMRALRGLVPLTDVELSVLTQSVGELLIVQAHTGEEALDTVLRAVEKNIFGIIVIDSLSNLIPIANAGRELDDENKRAAHASMMTDFVKQLTPLLNRFGEPNYTTLIGIAQARANSAKATAGPRAKYMKDWEVPIAWAWKHAALQNILIWNGARIDRQHQKVKYAIGKSVHWSIGKGKAGAHEHVSGEYDFFFDDVCPDLKLPYGADRAETMLIEGMRCGVIKEYKGSIVLVRSSDNTALMADIPGLPVLKELLRQDFGLEQMVRQEIMAARGIECRYL